MKMPKIVTKTECLRVAGVDGLCSPSRTASAGAECARSTSGAVSLPPLGGTVSGMFLRCVSMHTEFGCAGAVGGLDRRGSEGDHLHQWRDGVQQPGHQGRCKLLPREEEPHHHYTGEGCSEHCSVVCIVLCACHETNGTRLALHIVCLLACCPCGICRLPSVTHRTSPCGQGRVSQAHLRTEIVLTAASCACADRAQMRA